MAIQKVGNLMLMRLFLIDWLCDYINTSKYDMTLSIELLGILAIGIIAFLILSIVTAIILLINYFKEKRDTK